MKNQKKKYFCFFSNWNIKASTSTLTKIKPLKVNLRDPENSFFVFLTTKNDYKRVKTTFKNTQKNIDFSRILMIFWENTCFTRVV